MLTVRLPKELGDRLDKLARETDRPKSYYVREALNEYMDDLEDIYLAERALEDIRAGRSHTIPFEEVARKYGLDD